jgi:hypothetical protein
VNAFILEPGEFSPVADATGLPRQRRQGVFRFVESPPLTLWHHLHLRLELDPPGQDLPFPTMFILDSVRRDGDACRVVAILERRARQDWPVASRVRADLSPILALWNLPMWDGDNEPGSAGSAGR